MPPKTPKSINTRRVGDTLAVRRPALYLLTLSDRLAKDGDAIVDRFFRILTDPNTDERTFLRYMKELHNLMGVREIMQTALALPKKGRPAEAEDPEVEERREAWLGALNRYPEAVDGEFTESAPEDDGPAAPPSPPRRRP